MSFLTNRPSDFARPLGHLPCEGAKRVERERERGNNNSVKKRGGEEEEEEPCRFPSDVLAGDGIRKGASRAEGPRSLQALPPSISWSLLVRFGAAARKRVLCSRYVRRLMFYPAYGSCFALFSQNPRGGLLASGASHVWSDGSKFRCIMIAANFVKCGELSPLHGLYYTPQGSLSDINTPEVRKRVMPSAF